MKIVGIFFFFFIIAEALYLENIYIHSYTNKITVCFLKIDILIKSFWVANPNPFIISQPPASPSTMQLIQNRLFTYSINFKQWAKAQQVQLLYREPITWNIHNLFHDILNMKT